MKASKYFISDELRMQGWWKWQLLEQTTDVPDKERLPSFLQQCSRHALQSPQEIIPKRLAFTCSGMFHTFYSLFFDELVIVGPVCLSDHKPLCSCSGTLCTSQCIRNVHLEMWIILFLVNPTKHFCAQVWPVLPSPTLFHFLSGLVEDFKQNRTVSLEGL